MRKYFPVLFFVSISIFATHVIASDKLYPVDEASNDPSFLKFRTSLINAVQKKDVSYLMNILTSDVRGGFGAGLGVNEFKQMWHPEQADSLLWSTLQNILKNGGTFTGPNQFLAPYYSSAFPQEYDPFEYAAILGKKIKLHEKPSSQSKTISLLSFDIVKVLEWRPVKDTLGMEWITIETLNKQKGHILASFIGSPSGYRAYFEKKDDHWKMTALVGGD